MIPEGNGEIETGTVRSVSGSRVLVECEPITFCGNCTAECRLAADTGKKRQIWIENRIGAKTGDLVSFRVRGGGIVFASAVLYFIPVVMLISGALAGSMFSGRMGIDADLGSILGGITGIVLSIAFAAFVSRIISGKKAFIPELVGVPDRTDRKG
ncbi:MAG: SoxR reducing system RseC family protein [Spirochaetes bacterium]|nr:SoxR reducing system RseC family protein [Spirochaetota bacterium]